MTDGQHSTLPATTTATDQIHVPRSVFSSKPVPTLCSSITTDWRLWPSFDNNSPLTTLASAETTSFLVKVRRLAVAARSNIVAPSCLQVSGGTGPALATLDAGAGDGWSYRHRGRGRKWEVPDYAELPSWNWGRARGRRHAT